MTTPNSPAKVASPKDPYKSLLSDFRKLRTESREFFGHNEVDKSPVLLDKWLKKAKTLPKPWPKSVLDSMLQHVPDPSNSKSCEFLRWVHKSNSSKGDVFLEALDFAFQAGLSPTTYIPRAGVSIFGLAAYTSNLPVVDLCFKRANKEDLRLVLSSEHLARNQQHMVGNTLLHRLISRHGDRYDYQAVVRLIVDRDPEALLQQTITGAYPDQEDNSSLAEECRAKRVALDKEHLTKAVSLDLEGQVSSPRHHKL